MIIIYRECDRLKKSLNFKVITVTSNFRRKFYVLIFCFKKFRHMRLTFNFSVIENLEPSGKSRRGSWSIRLAKFVSKNVTRKKSSAGDSSSFDDPIDVDLPSRLQIILSSKLFFIQF